MALVPARVQERFYSVLHHLSQLVKGLRLIAVEVEHAPQQLDLIRVQLLPFIVLQAVRKARKDLGVAAGHRARLHLQARREAPLAPGLLPTGPSDHSVNGC
jgi:hypothetical protein